MCVTAGSTLVRATVTATTPLNRVDAVGLIVVDRRVDDADAVGAAVARALVGAHRRTINRGWRQRGARAGDVTSSAIEPRWSRPAGQEEENLGRFGASMSWGRGTGYRALRFADPNDTPRDGRCQELSRRDPPRCR